jgi:hypothetical protein
MPWCGCGVFFKLKKPILFYDFGGICGRLDRDKVLLRALCWVDNTSILLHISTIGLISGDKPLLLLET